MAQRAFWTLRDMNFIAVITMFILSFAAVGTITSAAEETGTNAGLIVGALEHHHIQWRVARISQFSSGRAAQEDFEG